MKKMKLGIVGYGFMGHCDADMLKTFEDIELTAVADINPVQMEDAPEGWRLTPPSTSCLIRRILMW